MGTSSCAFSGPVPGTAEPVWDAPVLEWLNVNDVAAVLPPSRVTAHRLISDGRLPAIRIGNSPRGYTSAISTAISLPRAYPGRRVGLPLLAALGRPLPCMATSVESVATGERL